MTSLDFFYDESTITFLQNCSDYIADIGSIRVFLFFFLHIEHTDLLELEYSNRHVYT